MGLATRGQAVIVHLVSWADLSSLPPFFSYFLPPYTFIEYLCETRDGRNEWDSPVGNTKSVNRSFTIPGGELNLEVYSGHARNPTPSCMWQWQMRGMPRILFGSNEPYGNPLNCIQAKGKYFSST